MIEEQQSIDNRTMVKGANNLLFITLLVYMGASFAIEFLSIYFGEQLPFLRDTMFQLLMGQGMLLLPSLIYLKKKHLKIGRFLHFKGLHPVTFLLVLVFTGASYPIISLCNYLSLLVSENAIGGTVENLLAGYPLWACVLVIAFVPCFVEEFIFRGTLYYSYKRSGIIKAGFCTAILFGFFHMNINQMSYAVVMGLLFFVLNEATGSILSSMLVHFLINASSVVSSAAYYKQHGNLNTEVAQNQLSVPVTIIVLAIMSLFSLVILGFTLWGMVCLEKRKEVIIETFTNKNKEKCRVLSPTLVFALAICIAIMTLNQIAMMMQAG